MANRWTSSRDRVTRTDLRLTVRVDLDQLARALAAADPDDVEDMTLAEVRDAVREVLIEDGLSALVDVQYDQDHIDMVRAAFTAPAAATATPNRRSS